MITNYLQLKHVKGAYVYIEFQKTKQFSILIVVNKVSYCKTVLNLVIFKNKQKFQHKKIRLSSQSS